MADMSWQAILFDQLRRRLPTGASVRMVGSAVDPTTLDGWSDLDVRVTLPAAAVEVELLDDSAVWACDVHTDDHQVLRYVLRDGRRVDLSVDGGPVRAPSLSADNDVRFVAALAATKLGRGDRLIGLHLTLELMRSCLVQAMMLRDRQLGTTVHRYGAELDALADEVVAPLRDPLGATPRPTVVERTVELYGRWRHDLDLAYRPDWSGLVNVIDRGLLPPK